MSLDFGTIGVYDDLQALAKRAMIQNGERVMVLGYGSGDLAVIAAGHTDEPVVIVEDDPAKMVSARSQFKKIPGGKALFVQGGVNTLRQVSRTAILGDTNRTFDVVLMSDLVKELDDKDRQEVFQAIRPFASLTTRLVMHRIADDSREGDVTAGAVVYDLATQKILVKVQWFSREHKRTSVQQLLDIARQSELSPHSPVVVKLGDGQYERIEEEIPVYFIENIQYIRNCYGSDAEVRIPTRYSEEKEELELFIDMYDFVRGGDEIDGGDRSPKRYVKDHMVKRGLEANEGEWKDGQIWARLFRMYRTVVWVVECTKASPADWSSSRIGWAEKPYCASAVFQFRG